MEHADEVLKIALTKELKRVEWVEVEKISKSDDNPKLVFNNLNANHRPTKLI